MHEETLLHGLNFFFIIFLLSILPLKLGQYLLSLLFVLLLFFFNLLLFYFYHLLFNFVFTITVIPNSYPRLVTFFFLLIYFSF